MVLTLVADHDPAVTDLVATTLRGAGHDVTTAVDGNEARDLLLGRRFDLCVLDHELPGLGGLEVAATARDAGSETRFLLVPHHVDDSLAPEHLLRLVEQLVAQ